MFRDSLFLILQRTVDWGFGNTASLLPPSLPFQVYLCLFLNCIIENYISINCYFLCLNALREFLSTVVKIICCCSTYGILACTLEEIENKINYVVTVIFTVLCSF